MTVRLILVLLVFVLDVWALSRLFASGVRRREKLRWAAAIVALPIVGVLLWRRHARA